MTKVVGYMYNVLGKNVVLQQKLLHEPVKFFTFLDYYALRDKDWNSTSYVHELVKNIDGVQTELYYLKSNNKH